MDWLQTMKPMTLASLGIVIAVVALAALALISARRIRVADERRNVWTEQDAAAAKGAVAGMLDQARRLLEGSGVKLSARELTAVWAMCATIPPLLAAVVAAPLHIVLLALAAGAAAPVLYLGIARKRNEKRFEEMLGQAMPLIASNLRGGIALRQAIMPVCRDMDEPIRGEFEKLNSDILSGMPLPDAIDKMAERNKSKDLRLFASAVRAQQRTGGNLAEIVETVGKTIRARVEMRQEINAKTSQGRATAVIMVLVPPIMLAALWMMNDMYRDFYTTPMGLVVLVVCGFMEVVGYLATRKVCDIRCD